MKVHYISFFVDPFEAPDREVVVSPQRKVRYIADCLKERGIELVLVSTAFPSNGQSSLKGRNVLVDDLESHCYLSMSGKSGPGGTLRGMREAIKEYVSACVEPDDVVLAYHSPSYIPLYREWGEADFRFVLEVNDRYCFHYANSLRAKLVDIWERRSLACADGYILASSWMTEIIPAGSPSVVNYGDCSVYPLTQDRALGRPFRVVYAGVIENLRRAAYIVAESAAFLSQDYEVHIAGFGGPSDVAELEKTVAKVNGNDRGKVVFRGMLNGLELDEFLAAGNVAVNAHSYSNGEEWKARYSFPSKIPFYLGHGLHVITTCEQEFAVSPFHRCLRYFQGGSPSSLAQAVVDFSEENPSRADPCTVISEVDAAFKKGLEHMLYGKHAAQEVENGQA